MDSSRFERALERALTDVDCDVRRTTVEMFAEVMNVEQKERALTDVDCDVRRTAVEKCLILLK